MKKKIKMVKRKGNGVEVNVSVKGRNKVEKERKGERME